MGKPVKLNFISFFTLGNVDGSIWVTPVTIIAVYVVIVVMLINSIASLILNKKKHIPGNYSDSLQELISFASIIIGILCFFIRAKYDGIECRLSYGEFFMGVLLIVYGIILIIDAKVFVGENFSIDLDKPIESRIVYTDKEKEIARMKEEWDFGDEFGDIDQYDWYDLNDTALTELAELTYSFYHGEMSEEEFYKKRDEIVEKYYIGPERPETKDE